MSATTICALATPRGMGGIAIIRLSGPLSEDILKAIFRPVRARETLKSYSMMYGHVVDSENQIVDEVLAVLMRAPNSYTREDVAEVQCHGGEMCARRILSIMMDHGAVPAAPGEFTRRAFLNGRIDLSRAEAVMQLVGASSEAAARASVRQLEGGVSGFVRDISQQILSLLALIEAGLDFPDEIDEKATREQVQAEIQSIQSALSKRLNPKSARILREGASIVLAGRPNVGKSSLMNALLNQDRAIVTDIPGTTRDVLTERIMIGGVLAELSDTAGQRDTENPVERIGVDRAKNAMLQADIVLIVLDGSEPLTPSDRELIGQADERAIILLNKCDLPHAAEDAEIQGSMWISASTGENVDVLLKLLETRLSQSFSEDDLTVERHIRLAQRASDSLQNAQNTLSDGFPLDLVSMDLRDALSALSEITCIDPGEAMLDEIFSKFCVGK